MWFHVVSIWFDVFLCGFMWFLCCFLWFLYGFVWLLFGFMWFHEVSMWFHVVSMWFYVVSMWFYMVSMRLCVVSCGFWFVSVAPDSADQNHISGPTSVASAVLSRSNATPPPIVCWHQISSLKACESSVKIFGVLNIIYFLVGFALG